MASLIKQIVNTSGGAGSIFSQTRSHPQVTIVPARWISELNYGFPIKSDMERQSLVDSTHLFAAADRHWSSFFERLASRNEVVDASSKQLKTLVRKYGIPPQHRPRVWLRLTGSYRKLIENEGYYDSILSTHTNFPAKSQDIIEKDLNRSFPSHPYFTTSVDIAASAGTNEDSVVPSFLGQGQQKMRRILLAYSWRNPLVSYCQSFNYLVGILLLHFRSEEQVFWMFCTLVEDILPANYYNPDLKGVRVDGKVFHELLKVYVPKVAELFENARLQDDIASIFICSWFLSLFVNTFPLETVLRCWDCLFLEGNKVLFRQALAFFKIHQPELLQCRSRSEVIQFLSSSPRVCYDGHNLLRIGFGLRLFKRKHLQVLREKASDELHEEVEEMKRRREEKRLRRVSTLTHALGRFTPKSAHQRGPSIFDLPKTDFTAPSDFVRKREVSEIPKDPLLDTLVTDLEEVDSFQSPLLDSDVEALQFHAHSADALLAVHLGSCFKILEDLEPLTSSPLEN